jgi:hypothetical protein
MTYNIAPFGGAVYVRVSKLYPRSDYATIYRVATRKGEEYINKRFDTHPCAYTGDNFGVSPYERGGEYDRDVL